MAVRTGNLLVVDDELISLTVLATRLKNEGYFVTTAQDGQQALALLQSTPFDAVLLDLVMPGIDGFRVLLEMKADPVLKEIPVIVISALNEIDSVTRCIEIGAADFIFKPFDPILLRARLNACLSGKRLRDMERAFMAQLLEERTRLRALIDSSRDGLIMIGPDNVLRVINYPAIQLLHLPGKPKDWVDRSASAIVHTIHHFSPQSARSMLAQLRTMRDKKEDLSEGIYEFSTRYLHWLNLPVQTSETLSGHLIVLRDITETRRLEKMREELTRTMVHDLRNPLGNIRISLELLSNETDGFSDYQQDLINIARNSTGRMLTLVNAILDLSQLDSGQMPLNLQPTSMPELIQEVVRLQAPQALSKKIHLTYEIPAGIPLVCVDVDMIRRVLQNLVGNAIKFTPSSGTINISTWVSGPALLISVKDSGQGIANDIQGRLFQKFVTGKVEGRGSGLGLAFCRSAVQAHKGEIWVESSPGEGSDFRFSLPFDLKERSTETAMNFEEA